MAHLLARAKVEDFDTFWRVFSSDGTPLRQSHGSLGAQVFQSAEDPNDITILVEWESKAQLEAFLQDSRFREVLQRAGPIGRPEFTIVEKFGDLPG